MCYYKLNIIIDDKSFIFLLYIINKNMINWSNIRNFNNPDNEDLVNSINEQKLEQKRIMEIFNEKMKVFATERSFKSSLDILNIAIQLSNIRGNLIKSFEQYSRKLEEEIIKLNRIIDRKKNIIMMIYNFTFSMKITLFLIVPRFSILISTKSPSFKYFGLFIDIATPAGVPVEIISPGSIVIN